ncbi:agmatinase [Actinomadura sp. NBRC 104412]|uniref:agmatinase n=1 Tax=Actinomadura sp. NBRC 104412 TaxID=3032203 RepID=UPI0024A0EE3C|nr:agmatinase [Actinomadura sp. NBRC 104412]GLZ07312.1 agmatinase [Actinomadura sp. NBRC 104412]
MSSQEPPRPSRPTVGPSNALEFPRFAGLTTFARLPRSVDVPDFDVAVIGAPFDGGVSYRPGARFGPAAIRQGSRLLKPYNPALDVLPFAACQVVDAGDLGLNPFDIGEAMRQVEEGLRELTGDGRLAVTIGGDHTVALPALRAAHALHGPVALVHFDAHLDTWDTYFGEPYTHGTPFRRAAEEGLLLRDASAHVGIRGPLYDPRDLVDDARFGFTIVHCAEIDDLGVRGVVERVRERVRDAPVYLSIDIDVLDPAYAPGTGTPESGGMTSRELLGILRGFDGLNIVGADVVEVAPAYDHAEITSIAAATVTYELISLLAKGRAS